MKEKVLIVGAGLTGIVLAERFAADGRQVLIIDKRTHIGGNCYDFKDKNGILVKKYGPHIFHTDYEDVWDHLSKFTEWVPYRHEVVSFVDGNFIPMPFNLNTLYKAFPADVANSLEKKLIDCFGFGQKIPILELRDSKEKEIKDLANFIYEKMFLNYTRKQWGLKLEDIDPAVSGRVPIVIRRDNSYFPDKYQGIPGQGYTKMFKKMLKNKNIQVSLNTDYKKVKNKLKYSTLFYTGPIDEFFGYKFGRLEYRRLKIKFKTLKQEEYQPRAVVNYPNDFDFTRVTEFKKFLGQKNKKTTIGFEYPGEKGFMVWPVLTEKNKEIFQKYWQEAEKLKEKNVFFIGRLAEYKYYDMDDIVKNSLDLYNKITK